MVFCCNKTRIKMAAKHHFYLENAWYCLHNIVVLF